MKKSLFALALAGLFFTACKKEKKVDFTATDVTGTTTIKGTCTKNVVTPNGFGGWTTNGRVPAAGVRVNVRINKNQLYPNSIAQGADVYSAVTDNMGNYSISVKSNATGVNAAVTIEGFTGTLDTLINGVTKTGLYCNYFGVSTNLNAVTIGQTRTYDHNFNATNLSTNPNLIMTGLATITGSVGVSMILSSTTTPNPPVITTTIVPVGAGVTVYMTFDKDPSILAPKMYTTTTNAQGRYSFNNIPTVDMGTPGFNQNANIWIADYATTRDTLRILDGNPLSTITGPSGVFNNTSNFQAGLYSNEIRNAVNMVYNTWTPN